MWQLHLEITFLSRHILHQHWYTCLIALPYVETRSIEVSWLLSQSIPNLRFNIWDYRTSLRGFLNPVVNRIARQTLPTVNTKLFYEYCLHWVILPTKNTAKQNAAFGITILKHGRHFDYRNQPLNVLMRVCCLDCHEAGLCCYVVIHIENLLHPLQMFYFHLWPIYWLSLVLHLLWERRCFIFS
jgi:hypothetical protein